MRQLGRVRSFVSIIALGCAAAAVHADSVTMTFLGYGASQQAGISYNASRSWDARSTSGFSNITAGFHRFGVYGSERQSFCVQIFEGVTAGQSYTYEFTDVANVPDAPPAPGPIGAVKATLVQDLYTRFHAGLQSNLDAAAFQIALYEISHENITATDAAGALAQLDLARGAFQTSAQSESFQAAADMLAALGQGGFRSSGDSLRGLTNASAQDQILLVPVGAPAILAGLGLVGVAVLRRRMK